MANLSALQREVGAAIPSDLSTAFPSLQSEIATFTSGLSAAPPDLSSLRSEIAAVIANPSATVPDWSALQNEIPAITADLSHALPQLSFLSPGNATPVPAPAVPAAGYSAVYAFGDSLSDAGNVSIATLGVAPAAPYDAGRFTNGPVWVQDLSQALGLPAVKPSLAGGTDYAFGGAQTGATPAHQANPTDLPGQLAQFRANMPVAPSNALYTVWAGSNDVLDIANDSSLTPQQQQADVTAAVTNEVNFIGGLAATGARDFAVLNVPDLGKVPRETAAGPAVATRASTLAADYNAQLAGAVAQMVASGAVKVELFDTYSVLDGVIANPAAYGFTNATQPVWNGSLTDPASGTLAATGPAQNGYVFFDSLHPTAQVHALLGQGVASGLTGVA